MRGAATAAADNITHNVSTHQVPYLPAVRSVKLSANVLCGWDGAVSDDRGIAVRIPAEISDFFPFSEASGPTPALTQRVMDTPKWTVSETNHSPTLMSRLMSGGIPPLLLYTFMTCAGTAWRHSKICIAVQQMAVRYRYTNCFLVIYQSTVHKITCHHYVVFNQSISTLASEIHDAVYVTCSVYLAATCFGRHHQAHEKKYKAAETWCIIYWVHNIGNILLFGPDCWMFVCAGCSGAACCTASRCIPVRATKTERASIKRIRTDIFAIQAKTSSWVNHVCSRKPLVLAIHYWETVTWKVEHCLE